MHRSLESSAIFTNIVVRTCRSIRWSIIGLLVAVASLAGSLSTCQAQIRPATALTDIFSESILQSNLRAIHQRTESLDPESRYRWLVDWVLPGPTHDNFRFRGWFTTTNPGPQQITYDRVAITDATTAERQQLSRFVVGGNLMSPVLDLVDAAKQSSRLGQLEETVRNCPVADDYSQRCRLALLALIANKRERHNEALQHLEELYEIVSRDADGTFDRHWPETIACSEAVRVSELRGIVRDLLVLFDLPQDHHGSDLWSNHIMAITGRASVRHASSNAIPSVSSEQVTIESSDRFIANSLQHWHSASRFESRSRGLGRPAAQWQTQPGEIRNVANHLIDHLHYQIPLQGNYEIECEVASGGYGAMGHLSVGGHWFAVSNASKLHHGGFRVNGTASLLDPPLRNSNEWSRYRVVARDDLLTFYFNGRQIMQRVTPGGHDPWVAIRSIWEHNSGVRNLRITGQPEIPDRVWLFTDPSLSNWKSARANNWQAIATTNDWWRHSAEPEHGGIIGRRVNELPTGSHAETLEYYYRPMLEDGVIEYEFFYEPDSIEVHPALGRLVFLMRPEGTQLHWMTDGIYDSTSADPAAVVADSSDSAGSSQLPLRSGEWNRLKLRLSGNVVDLQLNGEDVFSRQLEATNQRYFGLFHYADRTESRVRNVVWRGNWPKTLPDLHQQELFVADHSSLDGVDQLEEEFHQSFVNQTVSPAVFEVAGRSLENGLKREVDGLRLTPLVNGGYQAIRLTGRKPIYGDFDMTLRFAELNLTAPTASVIGLLLAANEDGSGIMVGCGRTIDSKERVKANCKSTIPLPDGTNRYESQDLFDESMEGTLRLVRRGAQCHALIAHGDSNSFRYIGSQRFRSANSAARVEIRVSVSNNGRSSALIKDLTIRSNSDAVEKLRDPKVTALDQYTLAFPKTHSNDFQKLKDGGVSVSSGSARATEDGLKTVVAQAAVESVVSVDRKITGDFDAAVSVDVRRLPAIETEDRSAADNSVVALTAKVGDSGHYARLSVHRNSDQSLAVLAGVVRDGQPEEAIAVSEGVASVRALRLIRIQKTLFFVYSDGRVLNLLGSTPFDDGPVESGGLTMRSATASAEPVEVVWSSLQLRARSFD